MRELCVIYANCQGRALGTFLMKSDRFRDSYQLHYLDNYKMIEEGSILPVDLLKKAKVFIYQPIRSNHGLYSTDNLKGYLQPSCKTISFPYIYNDALWPLLEEGDKIKGEEIIVRMIKGGMNIKKIVGLFCAGKIDFEFDKRFQRSLAILKKKEEITDVKVSEYILKNLGKIKLFLTQNHQTSNLYVYCVNQVLSILGIPSLNPLSNFHHNEAKLPDCWPQSPYEVKYFQHQYICNWKQFFPEKIDSNWLRFHLRIIGKIYIKHSCSPLKAILCKIYISTIIKWNLLTGRGYLEINRVYDKGLSTSL